MKELARIKLSNGYSIVFNQGVEPEMPNEVRVDIYDKEDTWTQDLARIGNYFEGEDENEIIYDENKFLVQVPIQFNTLEQFTIDLRKDPEFTEEKLNDEDDDEIEDKLIEREESDEVKTEEYEDEGEEIEEESVKPGDRGEKVKEIQQKLKDLGYFNGQVKGNYLTITTNAVKAFQKDAGLQIDGECDKETLNRLFSSNAPKKKTDNINSTAEPAHGTAKEMDWWKSDIQKIFAKGTIATITDVETGLAWREQRRGGTNHADIQPCTAADTATFKKACKKWSWERRAVFLTIDGVNYAASINCMPHGGSSIKNNNFDGHHCLHVKSSRTHCSNKVCPKHQAMVKKAASATL